MSKMSEPVMKMMKKRETDICTYLASLSGKELTEGIKKMAVKHGVSRERVYQIRKKGCGN